MKDLIILCKSYKKDMFRAKRMAESVNRFNSDNIPLYISVPAEDFDDFSELFKGVLCQIITDETVLEKTYQIFGHMPKLFPKHLNQQLVKMEFWRLGLCENYLWIDSDNYFIKPFNKKTFLSDTGDPYTVRHNSHDLRIYSKKYNPKVIKDFEKMAVHVKSLFNRTGELYDFGYSPLIWSCKVLESFYFDYLKPSGKSIYEILYHYPCEMHLYGEYLHSANIIPILPIEPLFKVYHYNEMFFESEISGDSEQTLAKKYYGIVMQSNWTNIKESKKNDLQRFKRFLRNSRRKLKLINFRSE